MVKMAKMAGSMVYGVGIVPSISISISISIQYTWCSIQYTAAYWTRTHTLDYPTVHDHEHTPGAVYTHRTEQTSKLRLAAGERRHL